MHGAAHSLEFLKAALALSRIGRVTKLAQTFLHAFGHALILLLRKPLCLA